MANFYVREEDGTSKFVLEDSSGDILLEQQDVSPDFIVSVTAVYAPDVLEVRPSFIASVTALYAPNLVYSGGVSLSVAGTYSWLCPTDVFSVTAEVIAGGGSGFGDTTGNAGFSGGGGGAYAKRTSIPVTPGTLYTFVVGAGGPAGNNTGTDGSDSSFTGDAGVQAIAKGGKQGVGSTGGGGAGGLASASTGDTKFSGGKGGDGLALSSRGGAGGGASGNRLADGAAGSDSDGTTGGAPGGTGANGGGSGGNGGANTATGSGGSSPGGGGGGAGAHGSGSAGAAGRVIITPGIVLNFISSVTAVYAPSVPEVVVPFIASTTTIYGPFVLPQISPSFISSVTVVYAPSLSGPATIAVPFIASRTHVWAIFSEFDPNRTFGGPGNGGESFLIRLNANGVTDTATLAASIGVGGASTLTLTGDGAFPTDKPFVVTIDDEVLLVYQIALGSYHIRLRAVSNTTAATHTAGASVAWGDSYDMAITASRAIANSFTADINSTGTVVYPGWLICFDSTQAYDDTGARYPMHVTQLLGVFDAGAGSSGSSRCDGAQPSAIHTPTGVSDDCPAALCNPARIANDINVGDVAVLRYTNPEATVLDLGGRSTALQSWFGLKRVSTSDVDVTFTDPNGIVVDTTGTYDTFTGSVNDEWGEPIPLLTGIAPDASDLAGSPISTPNPVPWTTVTLPHADRFFTLGSSHGGYDEKGWPMCCLAVRQGARRIPYWQSWDWHDYAYVYDGFGTDCSFAQILINRNGIVFSGVPSVQLPGNQDIDGPDAVWDDPTYFAGASWYVAIFNTPYLVFGPSIGGTTIPPGSGGGSTAPGVDFGGGTTPGGGSVTVPPSVEGGSGGGIDQPLRGLHVWQKSGGF